MKYTLLKNLTDAIGRTYDKQEIVDNLKSEYYGELKPAPDHLIDLENLSHMFKNIRFEGDDLVGDLVVFNTPSGNNLQTLLDNSVSFTTSIRATGIVSDKKAVSEVDIIAFDLQVVKDSNNSHKKCEICGYWMEPWLICEDTDGCSYYYKDTDYE